MAGRFGKRLIRGLIVSVAAGALLLPWRTFAATPEEVDKAIRKGVEYLYSQQKGDSWDTPAPAKDGHGVTGNQWGGHTALAVYALLAAGEKPQNSPKLKAGIEWLKKQEGRINGTYAVGIRAQVWNLIPQDEEIRKCIQRDALTLLQGAQSDNTGKNFDGMWHYVPEARSYDHSTSQYGTLGLWALERAGLELPDALWRATETQWIKDQLPDGGWVYTPKPDERHAKSTVNMTAAGIATLFITQDYLRSMEGIKCSGNVTNPAIDKGMKWMEKNLPDAFKAKQVQPYGLYGIERIGVASGYKYFGTVDWYKEGAELAVRTQAGNGAWGGNIPNTAFCIVFLTRGRAPVVMNKLQYSIDGKEANWNQRPRDAANAVKYMMKQMERDLNWQIVNLGVAVDELHDAPILYIAGNQALKFTPAEEAKLKQFVHQGGIILGHADCGDAKFANSFKALGVKLFKYEFKALDRDHPIYTRQQFLWKNWKSKPDLLGMNNGVREVMLLIPSSDPAKAWQLADVNSKEEQFQVLNNIFLYAVEGRDLRFKGSTYLVNAEKKPTKQTVKVGRLQVGDNWDPEPGGWNRLAAVMNNTQATTLQTVPVKPDAASLKDLKVLHLTGTTKFTLTEPQQKALKDFVTTGGTLVIDAAGGSNEFAASVESALGQMFPGDSAQLMEALPAKHELYNLAGAKIGEVAYRPFARGKLPSGLRTPLLRGITLDGRLAVIYSREDLSGGLVGESVDGIHGYTPASATDLMRNLVVFGGVARPTTAPATRPATAPSTAPTAGTRPASATTTPAK